MPDARSLIQVIIDSGWTLTFAEDAKRVATARQAQGRLPEGWVLRARPPQADATVGRDTLIDECLAGLYCYDVRRLGPKPLAQFLGAADGASEEASA